MRDCVQSLIDPYAGGVFNPSLLVLPDSVYLGSRILMVARGPERVDNIDREDVRWQTVFGLFVIPMNRKVLNLPYLARESDLYTLKLPAERKMSFRRCENKDMDQVRGWRRTACEAIRAQVIQLRTVYRC